MLRPNRLSAQVFEHLPPVLAHYLDAARHFWLSGVPQEGRVELLERRGVFVDIDRLAGERRQMLAVLGPKWTRALSYRIGFEQGRRAAVRGDAAFEGNARLVLQSGLVYGQLEGWYTAEPVRFEFDLEDGSVYREVLVHDGAEAAAHIKVHPVSEWPVCWYTAGFMAGHVSEVLGRVVHTLETDCQGQGAGACRFVSKLAEEWGDEAAWAKAALKLESVEEALEGGGRQSAADEAALERKERELRSLRARLRTDRLLDALVADAEGMQPALVRARRMAASDAPVLLVGEAGTGKATFARAIHMGSRRGGGPFEAFSGAGLSPWEQVEALTGGHSQPGVITRAHGGTLYIEELGALALETQACLMRALEPHGGAEGAGMEWMEPDFRLAAGMEEEPETLRRSGRLREDVYYVLKTARLDLPPLRERGTDVLRLAELFLEEARARHGRPEAELSREAKDVLLGCAWPGNARQLKNAVDHAVLMAEGSVLGLGDLPEEVVTERAAPAPRHLTREVVEAALTRTRGNRTEAAALLGVGRTTLWRLMKRMGLA